MAKAQNLVICLIMFATRTWITVSYLTSSRFKFSPFCLTDSCDRRGTETARSKFECASQCDRNESCVGFLYPPTGNCSLLGPDCFSSPKCSSDDPTIYQRLLSPQYCQHESSLSESQMSCKCVKGWVGLLCERRPYGCDELFAYGYPPGHQWARIDVYRNQSYFIGTGCYGATSNTQTYIFCNDGNTNMSKSWTDYVDGFKNGRYAYWMGLKNILALNRMGLTRVNFELKIQDHNWKNHYFVAKCTNFTLQDANHRFAFTIGPCERKKTKTDFFPVTYELEDVMAMSAGQRFLSHDEDNNQGCAGKAGSGWWFPDCSSGVKLNALGYLPIRNKAPEIIMPGFDMNEDIRNGIAYVAMSFVIIH